MRFQSIPTAQTTHSFKISTLNPQQYEKYRIIDCDGSLRSFDPERIARAIAQSLLASEGGDFLPPHMRDLASDLCRQVCEQVSSRRPHGGSFMVEEIQDQAELALMRAEQFNAARLFTEHREARRHIRFDQQSYS